MKQNECDGNCGRIIFCSNCKKYPNWVRKIESNYVKPRKPISPEKLDQMKENGRRLGLATKARKKSQKNTSNSLI